MNKTHVKRTLRILLACFLLLVFVAIFLLSFRGMGGVNVNKTIIANKFC